jgi:peroxin-5
MPMGMHSMNFAGMAGAPTFHQDLKGKGKAVLSPAEFEAAFAAAEASDVSRFTELDAESTGLENAFSAAKLEPVAAEGELKDETSRWEAELNDMMNKYRESGEYEYGKDLQEAWENGLGSFDNEMAQEPLQFDDEGLPALGPYEFGMSCTDAYNLPSSFKIRFREEQ